MGAGERPEVNLLCEITTVAPAAGEAAGAPIQGSQNSQQPDKETGGS